MKNIYALRVRDYYENYFAFYETLSSAKKGAKDYLLNELDEYSKQHNTKIEIHELKINSFLQDDFNTEVCRFSYGDVV
jgi:hypothetical protein